MLRHTPLHHANMKYFGIKTTLLFLPVEKCGYGSQLASIYSFFFLFFQGILIFFCLKHCQCVLFILLLSVHSSLTSFSCSSLSIQLPSSSTNSRCWHWHTSKKKINFINPDYYFNPLSDASRIFFFFFFLPLSFCTTKGLKCKFSSCLGKQKNKD